MPPSIFDDLFVLELANNHLGDRDRGINMIDAFSEVVRNNGVRAAIKLQFRDVDSFIHPAFRTSQTIRYIKKTRETRLSEADYAVLVEHIRQCGCLPMATPFDEPSVDLCLKLQLPVIKIASSCITDWSLITCIAGAKKPVIVSTGGASVDELDALVAYFNQQQCPLAINHCVSLYPSKDDDLELNQIDFLKNRYPGHVIGFSTHEYQDWRASMAIAYAKGARTFERHIDIDDGVHPVSPYCSLPAQIDTWFKAYKQAHAMCGGSSERKAVPSLEERAYLNTLRRGVYAKRPLPIGYQFTDESEVNDVYLAIPLQAEQRAATRGLSGAVLRVTVEQDAAIWLSDLE